ncbi:MAG: TIGR04372 family glycosyltransferase [Oligoflexia bacterium]|nr:TIGR04372 family glycosyltransferase [Oligoflexia bacterium]
MNSILKRISFLEFSFINIIQIFLNYIPGLFFLSPHERAIGNAAEEVHFGVLYAKRNKKKLVLLRRYQIGSGPRIANKELYYLESEYIAGDFFSKSLTFFINSLLTFIGHSFAFFVYLLKNSSLSIVFFLKKLCGEKGPFPYAHYWTCFNDLTIGLDKIWENSDKNVVWQNEVKTNLKIRLNEKKNKICEKALYELGLKKDDWFVCLHVRESGFYNDPIDKRNNHINNYFLAIEEIVNRGGWVIRMGDSSMTKLPKLSERVIDYPFTKFKSPMMDFYLVNKCKFFLGQNSGILDMAYLFQKECVLANVTEWGIGYPRLNDSLIICKHFFSKSLKRYLSIHELLKLDFNSQDLHEFGGEFELLENTENEIKDVVAEFLKKDHDYAYSDLQKKFCIQRSLQIKKWLLKEFLHNDPVQNRIFKLRLASRADLGASLGRDFIKKNWSENYLNNS